MTNNLANSEGKFISFEGGEGVGKTTQIKRICKYLESQNIEYIATREPGGTPASEEIRQLFLSKHSKSFSHNTDLLLNFAARSEHIDKVIRPALKQGKWVICDRFIDSTIVYQGHIGGIDINKIINMHDLLFDKLYPNLTIILDLNIDIAMRRTLARGENNRFDNQSREFYQRISEAYKNVALTNNLRCKLINVSDSIENVEKQIIKLINQI